MVKSLSILLVILTLNLNFAQSKEEILSEAYRLYNSEKASWLGTDILLEKYSNLQEQLGGYFSYEEDSLVKCIFFNNSDEPKVILSCVFTKEFDLSKVVEQTEIRDLTNYEKDLFIIRSNTYDIIQSDTLFKFYENTNFNIIPVITPAEKKVYILTGPKTNGVIILGNDYLLEFDANNNLLSRKALHKNIIVYKIDNKIETPATIHNHLESTGELITPTDICTLLLYSDYVNWNTHIVSSDKQVSIWDIKKKELMILSREAWDKIYSDKK